MITDVRSNYNVDPSRILLDRRVNGRRGDMEHRVEVPGRSRRGAGVLRLRRDVAVENLANVPLWSIHDKTDWAVVIDRERSATRLIKDWGYPVRISELQGHGHDAAGGAAAAGLKTEEWLLSNRRPDAPSMIVYVTDTPARRRGLLGGDT